MTQNQGQGGGQGGQSGAGAATGPKLGAESQGQGQQQKYVVKTDFTDEKGRQWTVGTAFTGDGEAIKKALQQGQIEAKPV